MIPVHMQDFFQRKATEWEAKAAAEPESRSAKFWAEIYAGYAGRHTPDTEPKDLDENTT